MELAIGVMFLMIAFTIMLLSTAGLQNRHRNDDYKDFNQMIEVNNVGEFVVGEIKKGNDFSDPITIEINGETVSYTVDKTTEINDGKTINKYDIYRGDGEGKELILTITLSDDGKTITSWK